MTNTVRAHGLAPQSKLLVAVDFNAHTGQLLDTAFALAERLHAIVHLAHACGTCTGGHVAWRVDAPHSDSYRSAQARLYELAEGRRPSGRLGQVHVREGDAVAGLTQVAEQIHADLIIVDPYRGPFAKTSPDSYAAALVHRAPCSVLVLRGSW